MRLGGPVFDYQDPDSWVAELRAWNYRAAYCPVGPDTPDDVLQAYAKAAAEADIAIAEVGIWNNVLHPDPAVSAKAIEDAKRKLELAERIGARCTVNVAGSLNAERHVPHVDDLSTATLEKIAAICREIIDAVGPKRTRYTVETMPWMIPDSVETTLELIRAVDRPAFGIHFDPVNLISTPRRFLANGAYLADYIDHVGPHIVAVHLKDIRLETDLTVILREVRPGLGGFDFKRFFREIDRLDDMPVLLEHLPNKDEYRLARDFVAGVLEGAETGG